MGIRASFPRHVDRLTRPVGAALARTPLTPNLVTTLGVLLTTVAAVLVGSGRPVAAGWVLLAGGLMDTFDGALARARSASSPFGAFYDSVSDRLSDGIILIGVAWFVRDSDVLFALALVALVAAQVTSYVRAKAESIDLDCTVGILERAERAVLIMVGLVLHSVMLLPVLAVLAVGSTVTVVQRVHHVWCQIDRDVPPELLGLTLGDRAWNRAYRVAARKFFGEQLYDSAAAGFAEDEHHGERSGDGGARLDLTEAEHWR